MRLSESCSFGYDLCSGTNAGLPSSSPAVFDMLERLSTGCMSLRFNLRRWSWPMESNQRAGRKRTNAEKFGRTGPLFIGLGSTGRLSEVNANGGGPSYLACHSKPPISRFSSPLTDDECELEFKMFIFNCSPVSLVSALRPGFSAFHWFFSNPAVFVYFRQLHFALGLPWYHCLWLNDLLIRDLPSQWQAATDTPFCSWGHSPKGQTQLVGLWRWCVGPIYCKCKLNSWCILTANMECSYPSKADICYIVLGLRPFP